MRKFSTPTIKKIVSHLKDNYNIILRPVWNEDTNHPVRNCYSHTDCNVCEGKYCGIYISPEGLHIECMSSISEALNRIDLKPTEFGNVEDLITTIDSKLKPYLLSSNLRFWEIKNFLGW